MRHKRFIPVITTLFCLFILFFIAQQQSAAGNSSITPAQTNANITIDVNATGTAINAYILGTNMPAWLGNWRTGDTTLINRTQAAQIPMLRLPGGSWSNYYDWSNCELNNQCPWDWGVMKPTDFIDFLQATNTDAMWTINMNGTAKEAAALVAFFNGSVNDDRAIGTDSQNRNWGKVSDWAKLRRDNGNPAPVDIKYFEIGNEIFGGRAGMGKDCLDWGWEDVWTCDGREYVNGLGNHDGFITYRNEMQAIDPSIMVGAVGVSFGNSPDWWINYNNWGNEVIEEAGDEMDFYIVHEYGYNEEPANYQAALAQPQSLWPALMDDLNDSFNQYAGGRQIPVAITEYNLFTVQENDNNQWMTRGVNMLYMADTMGQMMTNGVDIATQWNLSNGRAGNGTDYGIIDADNHARSPQYYVFPLWSKFGDTLLPVSSSHNAATTLSVYAGRVDADTVSVLAINKTGNTIQTSIELDGASTQLNGTADVAQVNTLSSQTAVYNGVSNPNDQLSNAPSTNLGALANPMPYAFLPYSITLLQLDIGVVVPPVITNIRPPYANVNEASANKTITIRGNHFASDCVVRWNGTALVTNFVNDTKVTAVIPAANLSTPREANITVRNIAEGTTSAPQPFIVYPEFTNWLYLPLSGK